MAGLIHIRIGKRLKEKMQELIDSGLFSNQSEIARESIRELVLKYEELKKYERLRKKRGKNEE